MLVFPGVTDLAAYQARGRGPRNSLSKDALGAELATQMLNQWDLDLGLAASKHYSELTTELLQALGAAK